MVIDLAIYATFITIETVANKTGAIRISKLKLVLRLSLLNNTN